MDIGRQLEAVLNAMADFGERVLRDPNDNKTLLILQEFATLEGAQAFASDPELKEDMQNAHVATLRRIEFFQDTD